MYKKIFIMLSNIRSTYIMIKTARLVTKNYVMYSIVYNVTVVHKELHIVSTNTNNDKILTSMITFIKNLAENIGDLWELCEDLCSDLILVGELRLLAGTVRVVVRGSLVLGALTPKVD